MKYISLDEEGYPLFSEKRVQDQAIGLEILKNLYFTENGALATKLQNQTTLVEAFDAPLVALNVSKPENEGFIWTAHFPYGLEYDFDLRALHVDEWDRFLGVTLQNAIPFAFSRAAQNSLFSLLDGFDDDSIEYGGEQISVTPYWRPRDDVKNADFWSQKYQTQQDHWDLGQAHPAIVDLVPRLKLPRSRILVLGSGPGHDAAFLAQDGHLVTAVDFSAEAIARAKSKYGHIKNINWIQDDIFKFCQDNPEAFDLIVEHTCLCAIDPSKRSNLIKAWKLALTPGGNLLAVLFTMERTAGPPFGGTEWEYRQRLKNDFRFIFWGRWRQSVDGRQGKELLIYAQKK
jgi:SAM-dependent methyltransferase